jgi:hypothetical protein
VIGSGWLGSGWFCDPVIVELLNGQAPFGTLETKGILSFGDTGTYLNPPGHGWS